MSETETLRLHERVTRGAAWLDEQRPGWFTEIDVPTLDISSCTHCITGQLGMGGRFGSAPPILSQWAVNLGFVGVITRDYPALRDLWVAAIEERQQ